MGDRKLFSPNFVEETIIKIIKIKKNIQTAQGKQKSYADLRRRDLKFEKGDRVFLKFTSFKRINRFGNREKLNPRFIGSFEILEQIGMTACRLVLPLELSRVHYVFHVSILSKYNQDPSHILSHEAFLLEYDLSYEKVPVGIVDLKSSAIEKFYSLRSYGRTIRRKRSLRNWNQTSESSIPSCLISKKITNLRN